MKHLLVILSCILFSCAPVIEDSPASVEDSIHASQYPEDKGSDINSPTELRLLVETSYSKIYSLKVDSAEYFFIEADGVNTSIVKHR